MLIPFDPDLVTFQHIKLVSITSAAGGSFRYRDEETDDGQTIREDISVGVARKFVKNHGGAFMAGYESCVLRYENRACAIELANQNSREVDTLDGLQEWTSHHEQIWNAVCDIIVDSHKRWYFDGRYVYSFSQDDLLAVVKSSPFCSPTGQFRSVAVTCFDLCKLEIEPVTRFCVAFYENDIATAISPPVWRNVQTTDDDSMGMLYATIDHDRHVNVTFALYASQVLAAAFGEHVIEPLGLPELMLDFRTVNLPKLTKTVKHMKQIRLSYTHAMAWLIGLTTRCTSLYQLEAIKACLVHLTKFGFTDGQYDVSAMVIGEMPVYGSIDEVCEAGHQKYSQQLGVVANDEDWDEISMMAAF